MTVYPKGRVRITYELADGSTGELPFVIGVLGDFSGTPDPPLSRFRDRERDFQEVNEENFDAVMAKLRPRIELQVDNRLDPGSTELRLVLSFKGLEDFEPEQIAAQVGPLRELVTKRGLLEGLRTALHRYPFVEALVAEGLRAPRAPAPQPGEGAVASELAAPAPAEQTAVAPAPREELDTGEQLRASRVDGNALTVQIDALRDIWIGSDDPCREPDLDALLCRGVARIDELLNAQVNAILHHEAFQRLEAAWRGLHYLVSACRADELLIVKVLSVTKRELARDLSIAAEFDLSALWNKVYEEEYGKFGGEPFGVLIGDYEFDNDHGEIDLLERIAGVAAAVHAPFIAAANPGLFGWDSFDAALVAPNLAELFRGPTYTRWNSFRKWPDSRYVGLTLPRVLLREPYRAAVLPSMSFPFEEDVDGRDRRGFLFGNGAFALGVRMARAFAAYHWCAAIRGLDGGLIDDLACPPFPTDALAGRPEGMPSTAERLLDGGERQREAARRLAWAARGPVEIDLTSAREQELAELGFIPIVHCQGTGAAVFYNTPSCQAPTTYDRASGTANARLSAQLQYILSASRFAHYLKVMMRDRIGTAMEREECERLVSGWLHRYCLDKPNMAPDGERARRPLRDASVKVSDDKFRPGWYRASIWLQPHFQLEDLEVGVNLTTELRPVRRAA